MLRKQNASPKHAYNTEFRKWAPRLPLEKVPNSFSPYFTYVVYTVTDLGQQSPSSCEKKYKTKVNKLKNPTWSYIQHITRPTYPNPFSPDHTTKIEKLTVAMTYTKQCGEFISMKEFGYKDYSVLHYLWESIPTKKMTINHINKHMVPQASYSAAQRYTKWHSL